MSSTAPKKELGKGITNQTAHAYLEGNLFPPLRSALHKVGSFRSFEIFYFSLSNSNIAT
jgi:hypothetical protein